MCNSTTFALRHTQISLSGILQHFRPPSRHLLLNTHDTNMEFLQRARTRVCVIHWLCSAQLSMFNMEKRYRNKIIIIIIISLVDPCSIFFCFSVKPKFFTPTHAIGMCTSLTVHFFPLCNPNLQSRNTKRIAFAQATCIM